MGLPCPNRTCNASTRCIETARVGNSTYRRRYCFYCDEVFITKETIYRLGQDEKNPFTIAHAIRTRKHLAQ